MANANVQRILEGATPKKVIVVPDRLVNHRRMKRIAAPLMALALAGALSGCGLHPLYSGGSSGVVATTLTRIQVAPIEGKSGWLVTNALNDRLAADGAAPLYRLEVKLDDKIIGLGVRADDSVVARAADAARALSAGRSRARHRAARCDCRLGCRHRRRQFANMRRSPPKIPRSSGFRGSSPTRSCRASRFTPSGRPPRRPSEDAGVKANANQIRAAIDAASPDIRLYLLHGPDESGAQEIAARLARTMGPDAERVDLEPAMLKSNPGRLADEAASMSLFGSARHIRIQGRATSAWRPSRCFWRRSGRAIRWW